MAGRPKGDVTKSRTDFENEISAELVDIPFSVSAIRVKVSQTMTRYPNTVYLLESTLDELDNIERRARTATAASARFYRERWR